MAGRTRCDNILRFSDETLFKLRARPIYPQDIEAVWGHIEELLDVAVTRKSESPFASPIAIVQKKTALVRPLGLGGDSFPGSGLQDSHPKPHYSPCISLC